MTVHALTVVRRRRTLLDLDTVARQSGLHPEIVRRLVRLGVVQRAGGTVQDPRFNAAAPARLARAVRLRRDLGLGWSGALLAGELLDRIARLEAAMRNDER